MFRYIGQAIARVSLVTILASNVNIAETQIKKQPNWKRGFYQQT